MSEHKNTKIWRIWLSLALLLITYFAYALFTSEDKSLFMPGELAGGHYQIGIACESCHGESFSDRDAMQENCVSCHGDQRKKPFDSHPKAKFTDPRNADRLENINALYCVSCHVEHKPELASKAGVTQPGDFCIHCHKDIAKDRPSHKTSILKAALTESLYSIEGKNKALKAAMSVITEAINSVI